MIKEWREQNKENIMICIAILMFFVVIVCAITLQPETQFIGGEEESAQTELANVELLVAASMAAPDIPIRDLVSDSRVGTPVLCNSNADNDVKELATDPKEGGYSLTKDVDTLISVNPAYIGTPMQPLTDFTNANTFDNWYCVTNEGRVAGFLSVEPFSNIRQL